MPKEPDLDPGLYEVKDDGTLVPLNAGTFSQDEDGNVSPAVDWQGPINRIPWEKVDQVLNNWSQRSSTERVVLSAAVYLLVTLILAMAGLLAWQGIIEGQALVGFMGAVVGYLLAKGRSGLAVGN